MQNLQSPIKTPFKTLTFFDKPAKYHSHFFANITKKSEFKQI